MAPRKIALTADYLVVGAGAMGMAFSDEIICTGKDKTTTIIMVDTRASVGGHWNDAYDFVKLHQPAAYYGVNSEVLGSGGTDLASKYQILAYFEKVLKSTDLTLWERNIQLAVFSLCIYLPYAMVEAPSPLAILHGWSLTTVVVAILGALGGILIGLVLSFSDSIVKNLALSFAITLTALVDHLLFDGPMNLPIVVSGATVLTSILQYTDSTS